MMSGQMILNRPLQHAWCVRLLTRDKLKENRRIIRCLGEKMANLKLI